MVDVSAAGHRKRKRMPGRDRTGIFHVCNRNEDDMRRQVVIHQLENGSLWVCVSLSGTGQCCGTIVKTRHHAAMYLKSLRAR